jgi:Cu/Zn superoxide dismutase
VDLLPGFLANPEGNNNGYVAYISGVRTEGPLSILGRSVVIHWGSVVGEAIPGQPNNRVACAVLRSAAGLI